jgi:multiple sugar transport system ATP-binding protein
VENHGVEQVVTLRAGDTLFKATASAVSKLRIDEEVPFALDQGKLHGFDAATGLNLARAG